RDYADRAPEPGLRPDPLQGPHDPRALADARPRRAVLVLKRTDSHECHPHPRATGLASRLRRCEGSHRACGHLPRARCLWRQCRRAAAPETVPTVVTQPADQRVVEGSAATFSVTADGAAPLA